MITKEVKTILIFIGFFTLAKAITSYFTIPGTGLLAFLTIIIWLGMRHKLAKKDELTYTENLVVITEEMIGALGAFSLMYDITDAYNFYPQRCGFISAFIWLIIRFKK